MPATLISRVHVKCGTLVDTNHRLGKDLISMSYQSLTKSSEMFYFPRKLQMKTDAYLVHHAARVRKRNERNYCGKET